MEDVTLLEKTKWRLNGLKKLKDWTMKTILNNLDAYTQDNIQSKLSPEAKDMVLQELLRTRRPGKTTSMEEFISMRRLVSVLMTTSTKKLEMDVVMSFYPKNKYSSAHDFKEVLKKASIAAPNIEYLKISSHELIHCYACESSRTEFIGHLRSLKKLIFLEVVANTRYHVDFALLCQGLPNLRIFSAKFINLYRIYISEAEIRSSFEHLRLLECDMTNSTRRIWEVLPQLDIVTDVRRRGLTLEEFLEDDTLPRRRKFFNHEETLFLVCPDFRDFSSVRHLEVQYNYGVCRNYQTLQVPTTLESLILRLFFLQGPFDNELRLYGASLRRLCLDSYGASEIDLNRVSERCPKLEILHLRSVSVSKNHTEAASFLNLKELVCIVEGSLTAVLSSAPSLQKLQIDGQHNELDDLKQMKNLIAENKIFGSLQSLHWEIGEFTSGPFFKEIAAILKIASATIPDLMDLKLCFMQNFINFLNIPSGLVSNHGFSEAIVNDAYLVEILNSYE